MVIENFVMLEGIHNVFKHRVVQGNMDRLLSAKSVHFYLDPQIFLWLGFFVLFVIMLWYITGSNREQPYSDLY